MATTIVPEYILPILVRYIDRYYLTWNMATRIISLHYGKKYIEKDAAKKCPASAQGAGLL